MHLKPRRTITAAGLAVAIIGTYVTWRGEAAQAAPAASPHTVLILGKTVVGGTASLEATQATALGFDVEVASDANWAAKTSADFATYKAIVLGDPQCKVGTGSLAAAEANRTVWGPAVTGNVLVTGSDPAWHAAHGNNQAGATKFTKDSIAFAAAGATTGAYISLSCYYAGAALGTPVPVLDPFGTFTVVGGGGDHTHIVASLPPELADLTDADLSNWHSSTHEGLVTWPSSFSVLVIQKDISSSFVAPDGTTGAPYILVRGGTPSIGPGTVCIVQLAASGEVLGMLVNHPTNFTLAVAIPSAQRTNVPVPCQDVEEVALAAANQEAFAVSVSVEVFTHQGASLCTRGPFTLPEHGAQGVVFGSDCVPK
jgi:hypothetical protein